MLKSNDSDIKIQSNCVFQGNVAIQGDLTFPSEQPCTDMSTIMVKRNQSQFSEYCINTFTPAEVQFTLANLLPDPAQNFQFTYYLNGNINIPQTFPTSIESMECLAKEKLGEYLFAYVGDQGVAGDGQTYKFNLEEMKCYKLLPKMAMAAASKPYVREQTINFANYAISVPAPIFVAPMGVQSVVNPQGDLVTVQGATDAPNAKISFMYSSAPTADLFFQMYSTNVPALNRNIINRAVAAGYKGIVLTLDNTKYAVREEELDIGFFPFTWKDKQLTGGQNTSSAEGIIHGIELFASDPVFNTVQASSALHSVSKSSFVNVIPGGPYPVNINQGFLVYSNISPAGASLVWDSVPPFPVDPLNPFNPRSVDWFVHEVQVRNNMPLIVKGILRVDDAVKAVQKGVSGIYVSNHGGRQVNGSVAAIDQLKPIADAVKTEAINLSVAKPAILFDSGIRRGSDVVKAYGLGAEWVGVGRPILYGLGAGGKDGVMHVIQTIMSDIENTTQNMGYTNVSLVQPGDVEKI